MNISVIDFWRGLHGCFTGPLPEGVLAVINAYFDASMDSPKGVAVVAGYIGRPEDYAAIEDTWKGLLANDDIERFRLTAFFGRFGKDGGRERVQKYIKLIRESELRCVYATLHGEDWEKSKPEMDDKYRAIFPQRQHACLDLLLTVLAQDHSLQYKGQDLTVVFDQDYGKDALAAQVYDNWRERTGHPGFASRVFVSGEQAKQYIPLQYADLVAGCLRQGPFDRALLDGKAAIDSLDVEALKHPHGGLPFNGARGASWSIQIARETQEALERIKNRFAS